MKRVKLFNEDNIQALKKLPDNSIDSVVSDPPYGLSFMNKRWDYDVPSVEFWKEVFRVLKPGGHVLSFGGTRTYHRMVVNIEDAGFEIRDQIQWIYGSGFPKSLNIEKQINKTNLCEYRKIAKTAVKSLRLLQVKLNEDMDDFVPENVVILQEVNQENKMVIGVVVGSNQTDISIYATKEDIEPSTILLLKNILEEGLNQVKKFITLTELKTIIDLKIWNLLQNQSMLGNTHIHESVMNMGTSLKPANEPICVARKPLSEKSVAENVLKWGTGGINVDGCRVGNDEIKSNGYYNQEDTGIMKMGISKNSKEIYEGNTHEGRFPANIIFECICDEVIKGEKGEPRISDKKGGSPIFGSDLSVDYKGKWPNDKGDIHTNPDCPCRILDEQSGVSKSNPRIAPKESIKDPSSYNTGVGGNSFLSDKGGSSRFFYQAKVSKAERNMGLDGFEDKKLCQGGYGGEWSSDKESDIGINKVKIYKNNHPTVKPVSLMTYLCRLITPKNGIVLDPFMGSGSTGVAAQLEGFRFCGMEMDPEYFKIAEARIDNFEKYRKFIKK